MDNKIHGRGRRRMQADDDSVLGYMYGEILGWAVNDWIEALNRESANRETTSTSLRTTSIKGGWGEPVPVDAAPLGRCEEREEMDDERLEVNVSTVLGAARTEMEDRYILINEREESRMGDG